MGWKDRAELVASDWKKRAEPLPRNEKEFNQSDAALRGGAQGLTAGFSDEISGLMGAAGEKFAGLFTDKLGDKSFGDTYREYRDAYRADNEDARKQHGKSYVGSEIAGNIASSLVPGLGMGKAATTAGRAAQAGKLGLLTGTGYSNADLTEGDVGGVAQDAAIGGLLSAGASGIGEKVLGLPKALSSRLRKSAEKSAVAATGATRNQAEKFATNAGRELLDTGVVSAGASPAGIASKAQKLIDKSGKDISGALSGLDEAGASVSRETLLDGLNAKIAELAKDESQAGVVTKLKKIAEGVASKEGVRSLSEIEKIKRGFQKGSNYAKPNSTQANKIAASVYRDAVEGAATKANPEVAEKFLQDKKLWGLMAPIQEAAERRAVQLGQQPKLGLLDVASIGAGGALGYGTDDPKNALIGGLAMPLLRRGIGPRISSTSAVSKDMLAKLLEILPSASPGVSQAVGRGAVGLLPSTNLYRRDK